jgi:hypothetical protein
VLKEHTFIICEPSKLFCCNESPEIGPFCFLVEVQNFFLHFGTPVLLHMPTVILTQKLEAVQDHTTSQLKISQSVSLPQCEPVISDIS